MKDLGRLRGWHKAHLTRDLNLLKESDHEQLERQVIEVKRILASFIKRLRAER